MNKTKLFLVDDHQIFIDGLQGILEDENNFEVSGHANSGKDAIKKIRYLNPDLVIMDIEMPDMDGYSTTRYISDHFPEIKVLALSMYDDLGSIRKMLDAGAHGYLFKNVDKHELITAINQIVEDGSYLEPKVLHLLLSQAAKPKKLSESILTARETDVLKLIATGFQNPEIADKLYISIFTVKSHRKNILSKLNLRNTAQLVRYAIENDYLNKPFSK